MWGDGVEAVEGECGPRVRGVGGGQRQGDGVGGEEVLKGGVRGRGCGAGVVIL